MLKQRQYLLKGLLSVLLAAQTRTLRVQRNTPAYNLVLWSGDAVFIIRISDYHALHTVT